MNFISTMRLISPVFADMLAKAKERNVLSLPDSATDLLNLVKIVCGEAGAVHQFQSNSQASLNLYVLAKKYNIVGTHACWITFWESTLAMTRLNALLSPVNTHHRLVVGNDGYQRLRTAQARVIREPEQ